MIRRASIRMGICLGLALASQLLDASPAVAQQEPPRSIIRLGGATRFTAPVNDVSALATTMGRATIREDLATVFEQAGMPALAMEAQRKLAVGEVTVATLPQGTTIQWMALRRQGPNVVRNLRWDGDAPLQGFEFTVDDLQQTYHFFVPAVCGNVSLISQEPSREAMRLAQVEKDAAAREAAIQAAAAAAEKARMAQEQYEAAEQARMAAAQAAAEQARMAQEQYEAAEQARLAAEQALAHYQAALERDLRVRPFVAGFAGKQQRQYDDTDPAGLGRLPVYGEGPGLPLKDVPAFFDTQLGVKGGVARKMSDRWTFAPAIGLAPNLDATDRTLLFGDAEIDFLFTSGAYLGTGVTFWDVTRSESITAGWLGTFGVPVWHSDERMNQALIAVEYRQLFDRLSDHDVNYQFWGGLKYVYR